MNNEYVKQLEANVKTLQAALNGVNSLKVAIAILASQHLQILINNSNSPKKHKNALKQFKVTLKNIENLIKINKDDNLNTILLKSCWNAASNKDGVIETETILESHELVAELNNFFDSIEEHPYTGFPEVKKQFLIKLKDDYNKTIKEEYSS